jgi:hypothetical protein
MTILKDISTFFKVGFLTFFFSEMVVLAFFMHSEKAHVAAFTVSFMVGFLRAFIKEDNTKPPTFEADKHQIHSRYKD